MPNLDMLKKRRRKRVRRRNKAQDAAEALRRRRAKDARKLARARKAREAHVKAIKKLDGMIREASQQKVKIDGNTVTGGSPRERLKAAAEHAAYLDATGTYRFYSQAGAYTVKYGITGEPSGYRSDCSQWVTSIYWSCGLPDPNGQNWTGGYTGTLGVNGREIRRDQLQPGDLILYGPYPHFHVEMYVGPGDRTIGHGSAPVDAGTIDMVNASKTYRTYV